MNPVNTQLIELSPRQTWGTIKSPSNPFPPPELWTHVRETPPPKTVYEAVDCYRTRSLRLAIFFEEQHVQWPDNLCFGPVLQGWDVMHSPLDYGFVNLQIYNPIILLCTLSALHQESIGPCKFINSEDFRPPCQLNGNSRSVQIVIRMWNALANVPGQLPKGLDYYEFVRISLNTLKTIPNGLLEASIFFRELAAAAIVETTNDGTPQAKLSAAAVYPPKPSPPKKTTDDTIKPTERIIKCKHWNELTPKRKKIVVIIAKHRTPITGPQIADALYPTRSTIDNDLEPEFRWLAKRGILRNTRGSGYWIAWAPPGAPTVVAQAAAFNTENAPE